MLKTLSFYIARACGSPWHATSPENGSCSTIYCALNAGKEGEMFKWGSGSDWIGRERLIGTAIDREADLFGEECAAAYDFIERLYKEHAFKLGVLETNGVY